MPRVLVLTKSIFPFFQSAVIDADKNLDEVAEDIPNRIGKFAMAIAGVMSLR